MYNKELLSEIKSAGGTIREVLNHFKHQIIYDNRKMIHCPFHNDGTASAQINDDDTLHCYACKYHLDPVQLYAAFFYKDVEIGKDIWEYDDLEQILVEMNETLDLQVDLGANLEDRNKDFMKEIKEKQIDKTPSFKYWTRNHAHADKPYSPIMLEATAAYVYSSYKTRQPLVLKVRYEKILDEGRKYFDYKDNDYVEKEVSPNYKDKTFRWYDIVAGAIGEKGQPNDKKNLVYNGHSVYSIMRKKSLSDKPWLWLVEGEKDVETLKKYGHIAFSFMNGSSFEWQTEYNSLFANCNIIIATDNDVAGRRFENASKVAFMKAKVKDSEGKDRPLLEGLKIFNRKFFDIEKMPDKSDMTDLIRKWEEEKWSKEAIKEKLAEIIERSIAIMGSKDKIFEHEDGYWSYTSGPKQVTDFIVADAVNIISIDENETDQIQLTIKGTDINCRSHVRIGAAHSIFGNADAFNKTFSAMDATFLGGKEDIFLLKKFIMRYKAFHTRYMYNVNGMYLHGKEWVTVTPDGSLRKDGSWDNDVFSSNNILYNDLVNVVIPDKAKIEEVVPALFAFNTKEVVYNVLGEIGSKLLNARYKALGIKNNLFSVNGTKGAGKTETTVKIFATMTGNSSKGEFNLSGQSNFTFLKNVSANNLGGIVFQELKLGKMTEYERNKWSEIFRNNYDRAKSQRGTKDQEINQYDQNNPIVVTGEEGIGEESALFERFNIIFMTPEIRKSDPQYENNFSIICDNQSVLRAFL